jgi:hypothetical protein
MYSTNIINTDYKSVTDEYIIYSLWKYFEKNISMTESLMDTTWSKSNIYITKLSKNKIYTFKRIKYIAKNFDDTDDTFTSFLFKLRNDKKHKLYFEDCWFTSLTRNYYSMDIYSRTSTVISNYTEYKYKKAINFSINYI